MSRSEKTQTAEVNTWTRTRPFTSQEFLESMRDGREIWIYGERVKDLTTHPAFRNTVRMLARLYDALHDKRNSILCCETDTGNGSFTEANSAGATSSTKATIVAIMRAFASKS
jgi:aromatic ring hydroxylase